MDNPSKLASTNAFRYWGKIGGGFYDPRIDKGMQSPRGKIIKIKRGGGANFSGNSQRKRRHYTWFFAQLARARGFINGVDIRPQKHS